MSEAIPSTDKTGEKDYGNIDSFIKNNNGFTLEGDFGSVSITGGELYFEIKET